jgi:hypothetical protein
LLYLLPVLVFSCTRYTPEDPDPTKCSAGEAWDVIEKMCVPTGCRLNIHCADGEYCNGLETCGADGKCQAGETVECAGAYPCMQGLCNEEKNRCDYSLHHESCPPGQVCDPAAGCVAGTTCTLDSECPQRFCFLERRCENNMCIWDISRDCSDDFQCTEDKCNEARGECEHIAHDTYCESADPCLQGRCDPTAPNADPDTGCAFVSLQGPPEICDGTDNDCDGLTDEGEIDSTEGAICACMTPCKIQADCNAGGVTTQCAHIDGVGSFCVAECNENECSASYMTCVIPEWSVVGTPACVCEPDGCPRNCACDQECFVYGLSLCMGGSCTSPCTLDDHCPGPYFCDPVLGHCSCMLDPGASCLACVLSMECDLRGLGNRCYDMNRGVPYSECKMHCSPDSPCPYPDENLLYCHQSTLCACSPPEGFCEDCQMTEHVCDPYRMECTLVAFADDLPVPMCTSPCDTAYDCPRDWACQYVEGNDDFRCVNPDCLECYQIGCESQVTDECEPLGLECIEISVDKWACSGFCSASGECPVGMICETGVCLCPN